MGREVQGAAEERRLRRSSALAGAGDGVVAVALPLLAVGLSGDPLVVAAVLAAQHLPWAAMALTRPRMFEAADQRTILGLAGTVRAVTAAVLGVLALAGAETTPVVLAAALVLGLGEALADGAEGLVSAGPAVGTGLFRSGMAGLAAVGLPLGGLLYALAAGVPFVVSMGLFAAAALACLTVPRRLGGAGAAATELTGPQGGLSALAQGTAGVTAVAVLSNAAGGAVLGVLVLFAVDDLGLGAPAFGLVSSGLAAAAALGAGAAPGAGRILGLRMGSALACAASGAAYAGAGLVADPARPYLAVLALAAGVGAGMAAAVLVLARLHLAFPPPGVDRSVAAFHIRAWGAVPFGALAGGVVGRTSGVVATLVGAGMVLAAAAVAAAVVSPAASPVLEKSG